jgi:Zn-dependent protease
VLFFDTTFAQVVGIAVALVIGITFHEFSHAFTADQLGDHRPRALGRVSLSPTAHIDPIGALVFVLAGFGWGKPVPVNVYALRPGRVGMAMVAAAGPIANVIVAVLAAVVFRVMNIAGVGGFALEVMYFVVLYNLLLAVFNLLPIPPLDGYNVVLAFVPARTAFTIQRYSQYGVLLLLLLVFLPGSPLGVMFDVVEAGTRILIGA